MKLRMEKRGCDFRADSEEAHISDVGNYRVITADYIPLKDGREMFFEFSLGRFPNIKTVHHRDGTTSTKIASYSSKLSINTDFVDAKGTWRDSKIENKIHTLRLDYTLENILFVVNAYSKEFYDEIEFI